MAGEEEPQEMVDGMENSDRGKAAGMESLDLGRPAGMELLVLVTVGDTELDGPSLCWEKLQHPLGIEDQENMLVGAVA